jgi:predicted exporter
MYDLIQSKINIDENVKLFSPIFYFVENSRIIKNDVNNISIIATLFLLLLYIIILRNIKLLVNTLMTLTSSILLSLLICSFIFDELSIFITAFGISISTVAIDYMFHHYVHNHYEKKKNFRKDVFLGMFTTVGAFFIVSFISFELIKQICYFAIISLLFSYIQFTFLYPKIGFTQKNIKTINYISIPKSSLISLFFYHLY